MPQSLAGLALFAALIAPGLAFYLVRDSRTPDREKSNLRETAGLVLVGLLCDFVALAVFAFLRLVASKHTPDIGAMVAHPAAYTREHFAYVVWWAVAVLAIAVAIAVVLGYNHERLPVPARVVHYESTWRKVFLSMPQHVTYVRVTLEDGTQFFGLIDWFSIEQRETADRELTIVGPPLTIRYPGTEVDQDYAASRVVISARRIMYLDVTYAPP